MTVGFLICSRLCLTDDQQQNHWHKIKSFYTYLSQQTCVKVNTCRDQTALQIRKLHSKKRLQLEVSCKQKIWLIQRLGN